MKFYAGIGSRTTPTDVQIQMTLIAVLLEGQGYVLRSGGAEGADTAFARGVKKESNKIILRPKHATAEAEVIASKAHPAWHACNDYVRKLHARNAQIVLGPKLDEIAEFVICWTPDETKGGTSLGLRIARDNKVPVFNFYGNHATQCRTFLSSVTKLALFEDGT